MSDFASRFLHYAQSVGALKCRADVASAADDLMAPLFTCESMAILVFRASDRDDTARDVVADSSQLLRNVPPDTLIELVNHWLSGRRAFVMQARLHEGQPQAMGVAAVALGGSSYLFLLALAPGPCHAADPAFEQLADLAMPHLGVACRTMLRREHRVARSKSAGTAQLISKREHEVLGKICQGLSDVEIAQQLGRSVHTVRDHVKNLLRKLRVSNRIEAAHMAAQFSMFIDEPDKGPPKS